MKIESNSLISDAKKITNITQNFYQPQEKNRPIRTQPPSFITEKFNVLRQKLFAIQSNISKNQTIREGLLNLLNETKSLEENFTSSQLKTFYNNIGKLSQKYQYNDEYLIEQQVKELFLQEIKSTSEISGFIEKINQEIVNIGEFIENERISLLKLKVSSENVISLNIENSDQFNEIIHYIEGLDHSRLKEIHVLESDLTHLLSD